MEPTLVFLPGKFHGQRSLVAYSPWSRKESDTAEHTHHICVYVYLCICVYIYVYIYIYIAQRPKIVLPYDFQEINKIEHSE